MSSIHSTRVTEIQAALRDAQLDGWLFCDFRHSDPLAWRILKLDPNVHATRRWFYFVPAEGSRPRLSIASKTVSSTICRGAKSFTYAGKSFTLLCGKS